MLVLPLLLFQSTSVHANHLYTGSPLTSISFNGPAASRLVKISLAVIMLTTAALLCCLLSALYGKGGKIRKWPEKANYIPGKHS